MQRRTLLVAAVAFLLLGCSEVTTAPEPMPDLEALAALKAESEQWRADNADLLHATGPQTPGSRALLNKMAQAAERLTVNPISLTVSTPSFNFGVAPVADADFCTDAFLALYVIDQQIKTYWDRTWPELLEGALKGLAGKDGMTGYGAEIMTAAAVYIKLKWQRDIIAGILRMECM